MPSRAGRLWFRSATPFRSDVVNWRDCLESLMSGDFLTPVFVGLMFHDTVRFFQLADRGSLLKPHLKNILRVLWSTRRLRLIAIADQGSNVRSCHCGRVRIAGSPCSSSTDTSVGSDNAY